VRRGVSGNNHSLEREPVMLVYNILCGHRWKWLRNRCVGIMFPLKMEVFICGWVDECADASVSAIQRESIREPRSSAVFLLYPSLFDDKG
jgi:hypothetical protein